MIYKWFHIWIGSSCYWVPVKYIYDAFKMGNLWKGYLPCALRAIIVNSYGFYIYQYTHDYLNNNT